MRSVINFTKDCWRVLPEIHLPPARFSSNAMHFSRKLRYLMNHLESTFEMESTYDGNCTLYLSNIYSPPCVQHVAVHLYFRGFLHLFVTELGTQGTQRYH